VFDGLIMMEGLGQNIIYLEPSRFDKATGHFNSQFCWCSPCPFNYINPDGKVTQELGHKNIIYHFSEDMSYESEE